MRNQICGIQEKVQELIGGARDYFQEWLKRTNHFFYFLYTIIVLTALASTAVIWRQNEVQVECLARNIYWEARSESRDNQSKVGLITLARVLDPRWPSTICDVVFEDNQFSWTRNAERVLRHEPKDARAWRTALDVAQELYDRPRLLMPPLWGCARFYKRVDNMGVSKNARDWFEENLVRVGMFGNHAAYADKRGCKYPIPTT